VVLVITAILGAVAAIRFFDKASFDAASYAEQTRALVRYAQKNAVAQNRPVFVVVGSGRIALCYNYQLDASCAGANRVLAPGGSSSGTAATLSACAAPTWLCEATPPNLSLTVLPAAAYFYFDALGRPFASADTAGSATSSFNGMLLRVSGDGRNTDVTIERETGYVY